MSAEVWTTLAIAIGTNVIAFAYGVGVYKTNVIALRKDVDAVKNDLNQVKKLIVMWLLGPDIDAELFTDDMDNLRRLVVKRKRHPGTLGD